MARSDLLLALASAAVSGDQVGVRQAISTLAADEEHKRHGVLAGRLRTLAQDSEKLVAFAAEPELGPPGDAASAHPSTRPHRPLSTVALSQPNNAVLREFIEEHGLVEVLSSNGLAPRTKLLFTGPPGTGKTSLASAVATELGLPMRTVRYENLIGSFLGSTGTDLRKLFAEAARQPSVLFFDEFETLAKERADPQDTGEMKRVVSTLVLMLDALPAHVVVIAATNHSELLDRAIWRRFDLHVELPTPTERERRSFAEVLAKRHKLEARDAVLETIDRGHDRPYSWVEAQVTSARRREIIARSKEGCAADGGTECQVTLI